MPEETDKNIRIPVPGEAGKHSGHRIRTIVVSANQGIKGLYCGTCKKIITYIFAKNKGWTMAKAKAWVQAHTKNLKSLNEITVDQEEEFLKLIAVMQDGQTEEYIPNSPSFELTDDIFDFTTGIDKMFEDGEEVADDDIEKQGKYHRARIIDPAKFQRGRFRTIDIDADKGIRAIIGRLKGETKTTIQSYLFDAKKWTPAQAKKWLKDHDIKYIAFDEGEKAKEKMCDSSAEVEVEEQMEIIKADKMKQIVYGIFLVPEKADHDGDVISVEDIEKVAHEFIVEYRTIDEMHRQIVKADIVESALAWKKDLEFYGKKLAKGTWFGGVKIHDRDVWNKVLSGEYSAFSVRIAGLREPIKEE